MKLSQWHKSGVKPIHKGIYQYRISYDYLFYSFWNGKSWGYKEHTIIDAYRERRNIGYIQHGEWRGIVK